MRPTKIFFLNSISATLIIDAPLAKKYGLDEDRNVEIEERSDGILIKRKQK